MSKGLLILNSILLVLVAVLFYLHFSSPRTAAASAPRVAAAGASSDSAARFRIAYFELDSVTNAFSMIKDVKSELSREEESISGQLSRLEKGYRDKVAQYQQQAQAGMSQTQSELANRDVMQMQNSIETKRAELDQRYKNLYMQRMQEVKSKIEDYLKEYNKTRGYSYIFGYEPGFIYYRDSAYNITDDLIRGLNDRYKKK